MKELEPKEFAQIASAIRTYYPREKILPNDEAMELWYEALKDLDYQSVSKALHRWIATERWSPSIADIRSMVSKETETEADHEWSDAWGEVERAIRNHGYYREQAALDSMSPVTRLCVKAIGWKNICLSEEIGVERGHFRSMYESKSKSVQKAKQIQPSLRTPDESNMLDGLIGSITKQLN